MYTRTMEVKTEDEKTFNIKKPKEELEDWKGHHSDTVKAEFHQDVKAHCALKGEPEDWKYITGAYLPSQHLIGESDTNPWGLAPALDVNNIDVNAFLDPYEADDDIDINDFPISPVKELYGADEDIDVNDFLIGRVEPLACGADDSPMEDVDHAFQGKHLELHSAVAVKEELQDDISLLNSILDLQHNLGLGGRPNSIYKVEEMNKKTLTQWHQRFQGLVAFFSTLIMYQVLQESSTTLCDIGIKHACGLHQRLSSLLLVYLLAWSMRCSELSPTSRGWSLDQCLWGKK
ncbi:uncharacterized protein LACBIDRAFT_335594 [Laccaria bicolor S238N-H82]|uniref:Predicted protein n=1 Tax=Laccaria bicolor (strain S238N-H82 / ATCC MYA-4686) TaxID=486041 RepID=B0E2S7_LACBS|nr:uncharacterized protein LACBIDRAFT_335594 [Laccaria bicolor S238N-H82]EDQ98857.1 predicted protein [Laccaria bicolor S238N-H82]|eukprot:XP_001890492.1 predicted protein [Laccaria bicolor S238N-H82]